MSTFTFYQGSRPRPQGQYLSKHDNGKTMAKTISKEPRTSASTKPKAGSISKKRVKIAHLAANLFEPIPITAITEHIATRVRFADHDFIKMFNTSASILNPTTIKTSNAAIAPILKVRPEPNLAATPMDALSAIPNTNIKEEPAEEEVTTTTTALTDAPSNLSTTTIKEEPAEEEATTNYVTIPTDHIVLGSDRDF